MLLTIPEPLETAVAKLSRLRAIRVLGKAPLSETPPSAIVWPVPLIVPLVQVVSPLTVRSPAPARAADSVKSPLIVEETLMVRVPPVRLKAARLLRLLTASDAEEEWVMVMPENAGPIKASSEAVGRRPRSQLPVLFQLLSLAAPVQLMVDRRVRSSSCSK